MLKTPEQKEQNESLSTKEKISRLQDVMEACFRCKMGGMFARSSEVGFSGDAASLFTLVEINKQVKLIKVGWGEFSHQTFSSGKYQSFIKSPVDLYCVSQSRSYFADGQTQYLLKNNPKKYLQQNAMFVSVSSSNSQKIISNPDYFIDKKSQLDYLPISKDYSEALCDLRNLAMDEACRRIQEISRFDATKEFLPTDFKSVICDVFAELADTKDDNELGKKINLFDYYKSLSPIDYQQANQVQKNEFYRKYSTDLLLDLGIEICGSRVGDKKSMQSVRELLKKINFEKQQFVK